ncbi:hypothetical protein SNE40_007838 [Patella caerulea]|uniref:RUN and SH3 domain-containing protein 1 n=1 Tax=Patella caerulea TaxID=87958 RepID=A0AAN8PY06_PATCE
MDSNENITKPTTRSFNTTRQATWKNMSPTHGQINTLLNNENCVDNVENNHKHCENLTNQNVAQTIDTKQCNNNVTGNTDKLDNMNYNNIETEIMMDSLNMNEGYQKLEARATLPKVRAKGKKKYSTWKDVSPSNSKENLVGRKMSDSFGSPKRSRSWDVSQSNSSQTVTWKDMSPTKLKAQVRQKSIRKKRPESGYYSNDVQSEGQDSREEFDSLSGSGSDQINNGRSSSSTPDDAGFSEYYYDEDFTVKFDTNIRNSSLKLKDEQEEELVFPPSLTGSYTRFGNLRESLSHPDLYFGNYESELSGSRTSMEVSSSEREMMCSSDMLDFSNDPLFTPTPTGDLAAQTYSTDSLSRDQANSTTSRSSGDGKLAVDCCPRKDEYFLSFNSSSQGQSTASLSSNSYASQTSSQDGIGTCSPSCSSNDGEEICSNSFHFCQAGQNDEFTNNNGNLRSHPSKSGLDVLQECSIEKSESTNGSKASSGHHSRRSPRNSPKSSPTKNSSKNSPKSSPQKSESAKLQPSKGTYGSLDGQQKLCGTDKQHSLRRVKNLTSWKQVKNLKKFGIMCNSSDRVHSMPDLSVQTSFNTTPHRTYTEQRDLQDISNSFHNKRHSSSLLELYQRMKSPTSMVSMDTIRAVEQILFPDNSINGRFNSECQYSPNSTDSSYDGSDHGCGCRFQEDTRCNSRNSCSSPVRFITPSKNYSRATAVSQDTVQLWHGTKNFSSQFPPKTQDCGVQASMDEPEPTPVLNQSQQTSPNIHREIMTILEDIGEHESRKPFKEPHQRKSSSETRPKPMEHKPTNRRSSSLSPSRYDQPKFYSYRSLPDLSFLSPAQKSDFSCESSLFDPVKIPIILTPVVDDSQQTQSSQRESGYCSCHKDKRYGGSRHKHFESGSSSGFSTSSTSSGIDPDYFECRCCQGSMAKDLERILFLPPHLECTQKFMDRRETSNSSHHHRSDHSGYDHHPSSMGKRKSSRKMSSSSSSNSTSSLHLDRLYSVKEESPTSPEKHEKLHTVFDQGAKLHGHVYRGYHLSGNMEKRYHNREYYEIEADEASYSIEVQEDISCGRKPLKSCLRKMDKGCRSRSLSNPDNLNAQLNDSSKPPRKPNRYSIACDSLFPQTVNKQVEVTEADNPQATLLKKDIQSSTTGIEEDFSEADPQSASSDDVSKANKRVSFASEVLFQSPQCSPQVSPHRLPSAAKVTSIEMEDEELRVEISEPVPPEKPKRLFTDIPPVEFQVSPTLDDLQQGSEELMELNRKIALLSNITRAAETLVLHFAQARDPFDKLRLGSVAETPEVGTLVFKELCPAMEQVIEDKMKPHRTGLHVFGKIHITPWRIAEMSAEVGPYTRSIHQLVKQLKSKPTLLSNKQRFYAFVAGLLNLRLLDFWVGYIQMKDDLVEQVYYPEAILRNSKTKLDKHYNSMLLALQPLSALPFQMEYDLVAQSPAGLRNCSSEIKSESDFQNVTDSVDWVKSGVPKSVSDSEQVAGSTKSRLPIPKAKSLPSNMGPTSNKGYSGAKKLTTFTGVRSGLNQIGQLRVDLSKVNLPKDELPPQERSSDSSSSSSSESKGNKTTWAQQSPTRSPTKMLFSGEFVEQKSESAVVGNVTVTGLTQKFIENRSLESSAGSIEKGDDSSSSLSMKALLDESPAKATAIVKKPELPKLSPKKTLDITTLIDKLLLSNKQPVIVKPVVKRPASSASDLKVDSSESDAVVGSAGFDTKNVNKIDSKVLADSVDEIGDDILGSEEAITQNTGSCVSITGSASNYQPNSTFAVIEASPIMHVQFVKPKVPERAIFNDHVKGCGHSDLALKRDDFRLTEFRYSIALQSYDPDDMNHLSYEEGDILEVLAQLDSDWLYCARGSQEGLVKITSVRPISAEDEFKLMHNDFYK